MNTSKTTSFHPAHRVASLLAVSALALGLAACGKTEEPTVGQRLDSAVEKTEQAAADARAKAEAAMQSAETKMEKGAASAEATAKQAADTAKGAIDDATITAQVNAGLAKDPDLSAVKINVDTVNGKVTLNGPAPSTVARDRAETIAKAVSGVTSVNNQLVVSAS
jgi:osmotically-inducible protein OsmY